MNIYKPSVQANFTYYLRCNLCGGTYPAIIETTTERHCKKCNVARGLMWSEETLLIKVV